MGIIYSHIRHDVNYIECNCSLDPLSERFPEFVVFGEEVVRVFRLERQQDGGEHAEGVGSLLGLGSLAGFPLEDEGAGDAGFR